MTPNSDDLQHSKADHAAQQSVESGHHNETCGSALRAVRCTTYSLSASLGCLKIGPDSAISRQPDVSILERAGAFRNWQIFEGQVCQRWGKSLIGYDIGQYHGSVADGKPNKEQNRSSRTMLPIGFLRRKEI